MYDLRLSAVQKVTKSNILKVYFLLTELQPLLLTKERPDLEKLALLTKMHVRSGLGKQRDQTA